MPGDLQPVRRQFARQEIDNLGTKHLVAIRPFKVHLGLPASHREGSAKDRAMNRAKDGQAVDRNDRFAAADHRIYVEFEQAIAMVVGKL